MEDIILKTILEDAEERPSGRIDSAWVSRIKLTLQSWNCGIKDYSIKADGTGYILCDRKLSIIENRKLYLEFRWRQCPNCLRIRPPIEDYYKDRTKKDGHHSTCIDCARKLQQKYNAINRRKRAIVNAKVASNPLSEFSPRELIAELRRRGYEGELTFTQRIKL